MARKPERLQNPLKRGDSLDIQPAVDAANVADVSEFEDVKKILADVNELEATPDMPRWGEGKGRLSFLQPGDMMMDPSYIPEVIELKDGTRRRIASHRVINDQLHILTPDGTEKFRWCRFESRRISLHKRRGFRFVSYAKLFDNSGLFEKGEGDVVRQGDLVLMQISMDGWERMCAQKRRLQAQYEGAADADTFNAGQKYGVPTFKENFRSGVREFFT